MLFIWYKRLAKLIAPSFRFSLSLTVTLKPTFINILFKQLIKIHIKYTKNQVLVVEPKNNFNNYLSAEISIFTMITYI